MLFKEEMHWCSNTYNSVADLNTSFVVDSMKFLRLGYNSHTVQGSSCITLTQPSHIAGSDTVIKTSVPHFALSKLWSAGSDAQYAAQ